MPTLIYLHGFNSSPQSHKAQLLGRFLAGRGQADSFCCPALPPRADVAIQIVEAQLARRAAKDLRPLTFVGSSLGGSMPPGWPKSTMPGRC